MTERMKFLLAEREQLRAACITNGINPDAVLREHWRIRTIIDGLCSIHQEPKNVIPLENGYEMVRRFTRLGWMIVPRKKKAA